MGITSKVIVLFDFLVFPLLFVFLAICSILELEAATSTVFAIANLLFSMVFDGICNILVLELVTSHSILQLGLM